MVTSNAWRPILWTICGLVSGFCVGVGCATSDQVLERQRMLQELEGGEACAGGKDEICYAGPRGTAGRGACKAGRRSCLNGVWTECAGQVVPGEEICNGVDDDCDGIVDNGFERQGALCFYEGAKGACRTQGHWRCSNDGKSSMCDAPIVKPTKESCDGVDNDCDGVVDDDVFADNASCSTGRSGVCEEGTRRCVKGQTLCVENTRPGPELCNQKDDDCNGLVDDNCVKR